jgi:arsenate reductase
MKSVLVICTGNSARSQMMEGMLNHYGRGKVEAQSAGTHPSKVNPFAIKAMSDIGINIAHHRSKSIDEFENQVFDVVITVCDSAKENCLFFPGKKVIHQSFADPAAVEGSDKEKVAAFRRVRDEELEWVREFLKEPRRDAKEREEHKE